MRSSTASLTRISARSYRVRARPAGAPGARPLRARHGGWTVELAAIAAPSPAYEIRAARCRVLGGPVAPEAGPGVETLAGARMAAAFGRGLPGGARRGGGGRG